MNNSFPRLIDGMIEALRQNVLPSTEGELARGQIFGVIFLLKTLRLRAGWSPSFLGEQLGALEELRVALERIDGLSPGAPRPAKRDERPLTTLDMEKARDAGDARVCELIDWQAALPPGARSAAVDHAVDAYLRRQLRHELSTSAKPMFAEISLGREK